MFGSFFSQLFTNLSCPASFIAAMLYANHVQVCVCVFRDKRCRCTTAVTLSDALRGKETEPPGSSMTLDFPLNHIFPPKGKPVHTCALTAVTWCHPVAVSAAVVLSIYLLSKRYSLPHKKCSAAQGSSSVKWWSNRAKVKFK